MRKASQDNGLIIGEEGKFIGIALGYDYCAEHEWGIKDLKYLCGIPDATKKNMGVTNRTITKVPPLIFKEETHKKVKFAVLYTGNRWHTDEENKKYLPHVFKNWVDDLLWNEKWNKEHPDTRGDKDNIITAWDGGSFGVAVMGEKNIEYLKELKKAIEDKIFTIAIANLRAKNPFAGSSLCLLITNRIPFETTQAMYNGDKEYFDREDYEERIGMKKIIANRMRNNDEYKGLHYFMACSPKWIDYDDEKNREKRKKELNTKYDIQYWVNYSDDDENYGWYTVEEIREWLTGDKRLVEIRKKH
jgi:hypothetical protein